MNRWHPVLAGAGATGRIPNIHWPLHTALQHSCSTTAAPPMIYGVSKQMKINWQSACGQWKGQRRRTCNP